MITPPWPQPHEGIRGALIAMARHLHAATLVGHPAPGEPRHD